MEDWSKGMQHRGSSLGVG